MSGGFRESEGITADVGIEAWGGSLEEVFTSAAEGLASLMADRDTLTGDLTRRVSVIADDRAALLVGFLNEIIFLEETEGFLPQRVRSLAIEGNALSAQIAGCTYDPAKHSLNMAVKAATYHELRIDENNEDVRVQVIFDV